MMANVSISHCMPDPEAPRDWAFFIQGNAMFTAPILPELRDIILSHYPNAKSIQDRRILAHILLYPQKCEVSVGTVFTAMRGAEYVGKVPQWLQNNYEHERTLRESISRIEIEAEVIPAFWDNHVHDKNFVTSVVVQQLPDDVKRAIKEVRSLHYRRNAKEERSKRERFDTGLPLTSKAERQSREESLETIQQISEHGLKHKWMVKKQVEVMSYLNSLHHRHFHSWLDAVEPIRSQVDALPQAAHDQQTDVLLSMLDEPQPFYKPSKNTPRLVPYGVSSLSLKSEFRKYFCPNHIELDGKNMHLAINAWLWSVPEVEEFLSRRISTWDYLLNEMGVQCNDRNYRLKKEAVKRLTYRSQYGSKRDSMDEYGREIFGKEWSINKWMDIQINGTMYDACQNRLSILRAMRDKGIPNVDELGRVIPWEKNTKIRSVLAQLTQAWEFRIMYSLFEDAFEAIKSRCGYSIVLYQYDGITVLPKRAHDSSAIIKRLTRIYRQECEKHGIDSMLIRS